MSEAFATRLDHNLLLRRIVAPEDLGGRWSSDYEFLLPMEVVECDCGWQDVSAKDPNLGRTERTSVVLRAAAAHLSWVADGLDGRGFVGAAPSVADDRNG